MVGADDSKTNSPSQSAWSEGQQPLGDDLYFVTYFCHLSLNTVSGVR